MSYWKEARLSTRADSGCTIKMPMQKFRTLTMQVTAASQSDIGSQKMGAQQANMSTSTPMLGGELMTICTRITRTSIHSFGAITLTTGRITVHQLSATRGK